MTALNDPDDRVPASNWFDAKAALSELERLKFSVAAMADSCGKPGTFEREMAANAAEGIKRRIDFLHDSLRRLLRVGGA